MKKLLSVFLIISLLLIHCSSYAALAAEEIAIDTVSTNTEFAIETAEIIKETELPSLMLRIIGRIKTNYSDFNFFGATETVVSEDGRFVLQFDSADKLSECLKKLKNDPDVIYAEQDRPIYTASLEKTAEHLSWGVDAIEADTYANSIVLPSSDSTATVAIVDSGCEDIDFIKDKLVQGYDFVDNDTDAANDTSVDSHGTFLASIITDCTQNLPVKIMPVRVLSSKSGSLINAINGIYYAVDNGADVVNISLGGVLNNCSSLDDALAYAEQCGVSVVVCAGNSKSDIKNYCPAHNENAITVSSVNSENVFSESFSNFGEQIDVSAPGENIVGYNSLGDKVALSGTSMSAAFVSAAAAMFRLENPACNTEQVRDSLALCTEDFGENGWDKYYGWGVLKLGKFAETDIKYVESVQFEQPDYTLSVGESIELFPVFVPNNSTDKTFFLSSSNGNIAVIGNRISAVSEGTSTLTVITNDGSYTDSCEIIIKGKKTYSITWNINDSVIIHTYEVGAYIVQPEISNNPEYSFKGWDTAVPETMPAENLTITAVFDKQYICPVCGNKIIGEDAFAEHIAEESQTKPTVRIKNNSGSRTINYGETLILTAITANKPNDAKICWYVDGVKRSEGETFEVSLSKGSVDVAVKLVDANGNVFRDEKNNEISDSQTVSVKSGFFRRIIAFFKKLFGLNRPIIQTIKK